MNVEVVKEIRFAVVMYGGVSLAIYINGVAQELLKMVRATAINEKTGEFLFDEERDGFDESEKSYRILSYLLADSALLAEFAPAIKDKESWKKMQTAIRLKLSSFASVKIVRFVVDIMSGSSAGGINAVYLSKALVGGQQINSLEKLWVDEGDFSRLLNDENSVDNRVLFLAKEPPSLFNSHRMYLKLLEAFDGMDTIEAEKDHQNTSDKSMIDEVDLFVTLTDFWGLPIPVRLFDKIIYERNHRRRLHFKYRRDGINDFKDENYPFLAYAARCTSSFPVAFEPMKLADTEAVLGKMQGGRKLPDNWKRYFPKERIQQKSAPVDWEKRVFVDGGTLDNKPFGYAIEALAQKQASVLIDRKLIYIEPKPDLDGGNQRVEWTHRPNAFKNTLDIVTSLPGYETIRDDLHRVLERNRLIEKVSYIVSNAQKDEYRLLDLIKHDLGKIISENRFLATERRNKDWSDLTIAEIARFKGQAIYPYYRLRMSALTDDLARLSARRAGFEDDSDYYLAIRSLVRAWRLKNYNKDEDAKSPNSIPKFLYDYDFNYRLRRLRFVLQEADKLLSALDKINFGLVEKENRVKSFADLSEEDFKKDKFSNDLKLRLDLIRRLKEDKDFQESIKSKEAMQILRQKFALIEDELFAPGAVSPIVTIFEANKDNLEPVLRKLKKSINRHLNELYSRQQLIETRLEDTQLPEISKQLNEKFSFVADNLTLEDLAELLGETTSQNTSNEYDFETSNKKVKEFLKDKPAVEKGIDEIGIVLKQIYNVKEKSLFGAVREAKNILHASPENTDSLENAVRSYLFHFYENFDSYDQIIFPITYETPIGEGDIVEIARISPADAVNLIDEENDHIRRKNRENCRDAEKLNNKAAGKRRKLAGNTFFSFSAFFNDKWRKNDIMWGRLDAVERLAELIIPGNDAVDTAEFKKIFITETQRAILEKNRDLFSKTSTADLVKFVRCDYEVDRTLKEDSLITATARSFGVAAKVLQSPTETLTNGNLKTKKPGKWFRFTAELIDSSARIIKTSAFRFSIREIFSFLLAPFRLGWLSIPFLLLFLLLLGVWSISYNFLTDFVFFSNFEAAVIKSLTSIGILGNSEILERTYKWILGLIFTFFSFYLVFFGLLYALKNFIFRWMKEKIVGKH